jgi:3-hydroxyacyl-[acyl-carrier-protein] dehydratase
MRFLYFDRIIEIESGKRIRAVKTFPLSEAYLKKHFSRAPLIPGSILVEAMSQITGWLVVYTHKCETSCVISLINNLEVPADLRAGATVELHGEIVETDRRWSNCRAWVERDGERIASAERFVFPHFKEKYPEEVANFYRDIGWIEPRWDWETP